jgi:protein-S-isoprenylcysteine O-methyltransferase Ste14
VDGGQHRLHRPFVIAGQNWSGLFDMELVPAGARIVAGCLLLLAGIPFMVIALRTLHRGFARGELFTRGVCGCCRHPICASWIVFLVPGLFLLWGSWIRVPDPRSGALLPLPPSLCPL